MAGRTSVPRLRSIRFKSGCHLRVLRRTDDTTYRDAMRKAAIDITGGEIGKDIAGFAMVAWDKDGYVVCDYSNSPRSPVPSGGVPDYTRAVLAAELAVRWSKDD